jgi:hypothetical protein
VLALASLAAAGASDDEVSRRRTDQGFVIPPSRSTSRHASAGWSKSHVTHLEESALSDADTLSADERLLIEGALSDLRCARPATTGCARAVA